MAAAAAGASARVFSMAHLTSPRLFVEFAHDHLFDRLPWALLAIGIVIVGFALVWLTKRLLSWLVLPSKYHTRHVRVGTYQNGKPMWREEHRRTSISVRHLFLETFFFVCAVIVIWIGAHVAGFNFWTSSLVGVGLGLVGTYMFGTALQQIGAGYFVYLCDKVEEGWYVELAGTKVAGRIREVHPLYVELELIDPTTNGLLHHQVPMTQILTGIVTRRFAEEAAMQYQTLHPEELQRWRTKRV